MLYKRELIFGEITTDLTAMSQVVFSQLDIIKDQLINKSNQKQTITQNELILDSFEVKLRRNVIQSMVLHSPRATDMRKIISCYDININLERIGDLLLNIHEHLNDIDFESNVYKELKDIFIHIFELTETMVRNSINCFINEDIELAAPTINSDDKVDELYIVIRDRIIELSIDKKHSAEQIRELLAFSDLAYNIERIADNATNIVEASVYLIEGKNIQHLH